jgi:hypothetical protein
MASGRGARFAFISKISFCAAAELWGSSAASVMGCPFQIGVSEEFLATVREEKFLVADRGKSN